MSRISGVIPALLFLMLSVLQTEPARGTDFSFENMPLKEVIQELQNKTGYYFLYRESQIAGIRVTLESDQDRIFDDLKEFLTHFKIRLLISHDRNQVLLTRFEDQKPRSRNVTVSGQIVDGSTGERLPFATITWNEDGDIKGIASNTSGRFTIQKSPQETGLTLTVSYIGFQHRQVDIQLPPSNRVEDLTIRLEPEPVRGNEIIIAGSISYNPSDTLTNRLMDAARFSPLGETNSIRALQSHPSVSAGTAINDGINVRGSTPDGFMVQLDGLSIFNQSHLFGLLDSFNPDAIQTAGYYYGITPAQMDTPTGGTLNLITRTGSLNEFRSSVGLSNTSLSGTFEGPLGKQSSWIISTRGSYIDALSWFNNDNLIQWGLDIDRPRRVTNETPDFTDLVLRPGDSSALFFDLHGKIYIENRDASRWMFSGYIGGDYTTQQAGRRTRTSSSGSGFVFQNVDTINEWGNLTFSLRYEKELNDKFFSSFMAGVSSYTTDFEKDDFVYSRLSSTDNSETVSVFTYPFQNRSSMNEVRTGQEFDFRSNRIHSIFGLNWKYYLGEYSEFSFDRPSYFQNVGSHMMQGYLQTNWSPIDRIELHAGLRTTYYTLNNELYWAPRGELVLSPFQTIRISFGYSINQQFLHRISLANSATADVWILTPESQKPAEAEQVTTGLQFSPFNGLLFQAEAYQKHYVNLRIHELNTQSLANTFSGTPWFYQNSGKAKGIEFLMRYHYRKLSISQTYTLSEMTFRNPFFLDGESFYADWDRRHSYNAMLEADLGRGFQIHFSWLMMSGAPNKLNIFENDPVERLDTYQRLDATLVFMHQFQNQSKFDLSFSVFNLLDRENVWYRNYSFSFDETRSVARLTPVPVDVFDLGFQPSFKVKYSF